MVLTDHLDPSSKLLTATDLYKFIWVRHGEVTLEIDQVETQLSAGEVISLTPLHHLQLRHVEGEVLFLLFNSVFYCIYGHDSEVSCNGFLFHGSARLLRLQLSTTEQARLESLIAAMRDEFEVEDNLQEEMLRIALKQFIIHCTRIARHHLGFEPGDEEQFDLIRQFYILVDDHFRELKQVQEYADRLHRSPKTLTHRFTAYGLPSPLKVIHQRLEAEAKRLLLYTSKPVKEIALWLGFEDLATFSRFFRKMTGESISTFRQREKSSQGEK
ncbi:MAG: helix-turn-helix domain-containing protein [Alistipes sp.]|nr:helix-turn-helix domain-containing protein [Alistipes sp.]